LLREQRPELGPRRGIPLLGLLDLADRLGARVAERQVTVGLGRILAPQSLDERSLALVRGFVAGGLLRERRRRRGKDEGERRGDERPGRADAAAQRRKPLTARTNRSGCSYGNMWPAASITSTRARGISAFQRSA